VAFYEQAFGLKVADRYAFDSFTLVYLSNAEAPFEVELTINHGRKEPYDLGSGYGHVAFTVEDLDAEHARMTAAGLEVNPIKEFHRDGALMARFFFVQDPDGYRIEVLQRHGRYR
jgi:lactoylglutathione lyase